MAGIFTDAINSRADFFAVLGRARQEIADVRKRLAADPTLQSIERQLELVDRYTANGRQPKVDERNSIDMAFRMAREFEGTHDRDLYRLRKLVSGVNHYFEYWPDDATAADPKNFDYLSPEKLRQQP